MLVFLHAQALLSLTSTITTQLSFSNELKDYSVQLVSVDICSVDSIHFQV